MDFLSRLRGGLLLPQFLQFDKNFLSRLRGGLLMPLINILLR